MIPTRTLLLLFCSIFLLSCNDSKKSESIIESTPEEINSIIEEHPFLGTDSTVQIPNGEFSVPVHIIVPEETLNGIIIALPGWNYPATDWCDSTNLCSKAMDEGYAIILPEMGKSIYCDNIYPETRKDWVQYPTRKWLREIMIPFLQQEFYLLTENHPNYVLGLSTGARGAALIAMDLPEVFSACAVLSGDYDQRPFPNDNLYRGFYGSRAKHTERWEHDDNVITNIEQFNVPVYIGHGSEDNIVPLKHSEIFKNALDSVQKTVKYHIASGAKHDYSYWNSEVDAMFDFFGKHK